MFAIGFILFVLVLAGIVKLVMPLLVAIVETLIRLGVLVLVITAIAMYFAA